MPTYKKPLNLKALGLPGAGTAQRFLLTVSEGIEQLEFNGAVVNRAGNVRVRADPDTAANLAIELTKTIQMFRDG